LPINALAVSAFATGLCVLLNVVMPGQAFGLLMSLVVSALVINWIMICVTHLKFRKAKDQQQQITQFKSLGYPLTNTLCLLFLLGILVVMAMTPGMSISVWLIPVWLVLLGGGYLIKCKYAEPDTLVGVRES
jgi:aromatic amino acid transport protein AroP